MRSSRGIRIGRASEWLAIGAVVGLVLAGCSSDPGPQPSAPPETTAPTEDPTPTPTETVPPETVEPERPEAMDEVSVEGAEAVATYYTSLFPYIHSTGDLAAWRELSHPECVFCTNVVDGVEEMRERGERVEGGALTWGEVTSTETDPGKWWLVTFAVDEAASATLDSDDRVVSESEARRYRMDIAVIRHDNRWLVRELSYTDLTDED